MPQVCGMCIGGEQKSLVKWAEKNQNPKALSLHSTSCRAINNEELKRVGMNVTRKSGMEERRDCGRSLSRREGLRKKKEKERISSNVSGGKIDVRQ